MKATNSTEKVILDYFEKNASDDLKKRVEAEKKTITGALKYCSSQAQKYRSGNCACVDDATVFGWVMHYFEDEDAKKWEAKPAQARVKASAKKNPAKKTANKSPETKTPAVKESAAPVKESDVPVKESAPAMKDLEAVPPARPPVRVVTPVSPLPPISKRERRERDAGQLFIFDQTAEGGKV